MGFSPRTGNDYPRSDRWPLVNYFSDPGRAGERDGDTKPWIEHAEPVDTDALKVRPCSPGFIYITSQAPCQHPVVRVMAARMAAECFWLNARRSILRRNAVVDVLRHDGVAPSLHRKRHAPVDTTEGPRRMTSMTAASPPSRSSSLLVVNTLVMPDNSLPFEITMT